MKCRCVVLLPLVFQVACGSKSTTDQSTSDASNSDVEALEEAEGTEPPPAVEDTGSPDDSSDEPDDEPGDDLNDEEDTGPDDVATEDTGAASVDSDEEVDWPMWPEGTDPFADEVILFEPGPDAGFGMESFPDIVLGSPEGRGAGAGSLDVLSLGEEGQIVLAFNDLDVFDGPGPDLIVFENPFGTWFETAFVEASVNGEDWYAWPCDPEDVDGDYPGCAGVGHVFASSDSTIDPTDPELAGGDVYDLADIGLETARFVRITDTGFNALGYGGIAGGFDLDAVAIVNWESITDGK